MPSTAEWTKTGQELFVNLIDPATRASVSTSFFGNTGADATAADVDDTDLGAENAEDREETVITQPDAYRIQYAFTVTFTDDRVCNEVAVFDADTAGTLVGRAQYPTVNAETGDEIGFRIQIPFRSGSEPTP